MEKAFKIDYEELEDIFYLGRDEKVKFSIDLALPSGDAVVDMGFDGLVKGIEIFNASKFFSLIKEQLKSIKDADFSIIYSPSYVSVNISLQAGKDTVKNSIIVPYNKRMILAE
jgi:uncharacterized protein YuzE